MDNYSNATLVYCTGPNKGLVKTEFKTRVQDRGTNLKSFERKKKANRSVPGTSWSSIGIN